MTEQHHKHISVDAPSEATILAARHLDTEGRVQVGSIVDTSTRSAITTVLRYIAKAHNSPSAPAEQAERVRKLHPRNEHTGDCEYCSARDYPDYSVPYPCDTVQALDGAGPAAADATQPGGFLTEREIAALKAHGQPGTRATRPVIDEALRQMDADPHGLKAGMIVKSYREYGQEKWVFRCWGNDTGCDGLVSLDHTSQATAERARDRHLTEDHTEQQ